MGEDSEDSGSPVPPWRRATSSAAMDTAVSAGLRPPRSRSYPSGWSSNPAATFRSRHVAVGPSVPIQNFST